MRMEYTLLGLSIPIWLSTSISLPRIFPLWIESYGVPQQEILESWMKSINALRNCCAHHGRVWNRVMPVMPQLPMTLKQAWITNKPEVANRLYSVLCCLLYWLNAIDSQNELCANFKDLLSWYPEVDTNAMGFPLGWENEPLWRQ